MFAKVKEILKGKKMSMLVIEDGEPTYIILPIEEYEKMKAGEVKEIKEEKEEKFEVIDVNEVSGSVESAEEFAFNEENELDWLSALDDEDDDEEEKGEEKNDSGFEIPEEFLTDTSEDKEIKGNNVIKKEEISIEDLPF